MKLSLDIAAIFIDCPNGTEFKYIPRCPASMKAVSYSMTRKISPLNR